MVDEQAVRRAEQALEALQDNFKEWLSSDVELLKEATNALKSDCGNKEAISTITLKAHDLKGLGVTYNYPLITRISASLHRLIDEAKTHNEATTDLVEKHVLALQAIVTGNVKTADNPVGVLLARKLEEVVDESSGS